MRQTPILSPADLRTILAVLTAQRDLMIEGGCTNTELGHYVRVQHKIEQMYNIAVSPKADDA